jgi:glyceraldehyde 3-phosphate dehydrogenase
LGIAINGLGRIGRLAVKRLARQSPDRLKAINDPAGLEVVLNLLRFDSVHGREPLRIDSHLKDGQERLRIGDCVVPLFHEVDPAVIPFGASGANLVVECSGHFTRRDAAARHLHGGVSHVVISAPSPDPDITVIEPVEPGQLDLTRPRIISNASCTAHAAAPILKVLHEAFGLVHAGLGTVHVATNDQRLLDAPHQDLRRGRSAFQSIIPTTTSAIGALKQALPWLPKDFDGLALRVPTTSVNLVEIMAGVSRDVDLMSLKAAFEKAAAGPFRGIIGLAEGVEVSCDFTGREESVVMDLGLSQCLGNRFLRVFGWHDNEVAYTARLVELVLGIDTRLAG